tara:strand:+ start:1711 stop:1812 length:102 start_codon:yes stop_codon:yes gene_type:complete
MVDKIVTLAFEVWAIEILMIDKKTITSDRIRKE